MPRHDDRRHAVRVHVRELGPHGQPLPWVPWGVPRWCVGVCILFCLAPSVRSHSGFHLQSPMHDQPPRPDLLPEGADAWACPHKDCVDKDTLFCTLDNVRLHWWRTHMPKIFVCTTGCGKVFSYKPDWRFHVKYCGKSIGWIWPSEDEDLLQQ